MFKKIVNGHNSISYGGSGSLVFKEKGKNHWIVDSKGKTIIYRAADNKFTVNMNQNYFKISYYNHDSWDDRNSYLFETNYFGDFAYKGTTLNYQDNSGANMGYNVNKNGSTVYNYSPKTRASYSHSYGNWYIAFLPVFEIQER